MGKQGYFSYFSSELDEAARRAVEATTARGAALYKRGTHLHRLVRIENELGQDDQRARRARILKLLASALRAEGRLGRSGHWTYDLNRHIALRQAYRAELTSDQGCTTAETLARNRSVNG